MSLQKNISSDTFKTFELEDVAQLVRHMMKQRSCFSWSSSEAVLLCVMHMMSPALLTSSRPWCWTKITPCNDYSSHITDVVNGLEGCNLPRWPLDLSHLLSSSPLALIGYLSVIFIHSSIAFYSQSSTVNTKEHCALLQISCYSNLIT